MTLDKSKVFHAVNAEDAEQYIGKQGWFADRGELLKQSVQEETKKFELTEIQDGYEPYRFKTTKGEFALFYPAPEPEYRPFETCEEVIPHAGRLMKKIEVIQEREEKYETIHRIEKNNSKIFINSISAELVLEWFVFEDTGKPVGVQE